MFRSSRFWWLLSYWMAGRQQIFMLLLFVGCCCCCSCCFYANTRFAANTFHESRKSLELPLEASASVAAAAAAPPFLVFPWHYICIIANMLNIECFIIQSSTSSSSSLANDSTRNYFQAMTITVANKRRRRRNNCRLKLYLYNLCESAFIVLFMLVVKRNVLISLN